MVNIDNMILNENYFTYIMVGKEKLIMSVKCQSKIKNIVISALNH